MFTIITSKLKSTTWLMLSMASLMQMKRCCKSQRKQHYSLTVHVQKAVVGLLIDWSTDRLIDDGLNLWVPWSSTLWAWLSFVKLLATSMTGVRPLPHSLWQLFVEDRDDHSSRITKCLLPAISQGFDGQLRSTKTEKRIGKMTGCGQAQCSSIKGLQRLPATMIVIIG